jgi:hypothetical protein
MPQCPLIYPGDLFEKSGRMCARKIFRRNEFCDRLEVTEAQLVEFGIAYGNDFTKSINNKAIQISHNLGFLGIFPLKEPRETFMLRLVKEFARAIQDNKIFSFDLEIQKRLTF